MNTSDLVSLLPWPKSDANKYSRGKAVLVAGSASYPGAACMAAYATERVGAGYTEVYCAPEALPVLRSFRPTLVVRSWESWVPRDMPQLRSEEQRPVACLIGSGMDPDDEQQMRLALKVLANVEAPALVDGGAFTALATPEGGTVANERASKGLPTVLTPHAGEAARLAKGVGLDADASHPADLARALSAAYQATIVLKGPDTHIADAATERTAVMTQGTSALAKAGTGDVLAGIIAGFLAQGMDAFDAALLGTTLHAEAARAASADLTVISVTALDVADAIPEAIRELA